MSTYKVIIRYKKDQDTGKKLPIVNAQSEAVIYVQYQHLSKTALFSTGVKVLPKYFIVGKYDNYISKAVRGFSSDHVKINKILEDLKDSVKQLIIRNQEPFPDEVKKYYLLNHKTQKSASDNIFKSFDRFIEIYKSTRAPGTIKQYKSAKSHLEGFNPSMKIKDFNNKFYDNYTTYLVEKKKLSSNSCANQFKNIKVFLKWLEQQGNILSISPSSIKVSHLKQNPLIIFLTSEEIQKINEKEDLSAGLNKVRDLFLFQCSTGLRYSDLKRIGKPHIHERLLILKAHKNRKKITVPLNQLSEGILKKYDYKLPLISNQKYNDYIKDLCEACEINEQVELTKVTGGNKVYTKAAKHEVVSSHTAVKTFITLMLDNGYTASEVAEMTGKTVDVINDHYAGVDKKTLLNKMNNIKEFFPIMKIA